jgi:hypothetical protein
MDTSPLRETPAKQPPQQQQPPAGKLSAAEFAAAVAGGAAASAPGNGTSGGARSEDADEPMEQWKAGKVASTSAPEDLSAFEDDKNSTHLLEMSSTQSVLTSVCCVSERTPVSVQPPR